MLSPCIRVQVIHGSALENMAAALCKQALQQWRIVVKHCFQAYEVSGVLAGKTEVSQPARRLVSQTAQGLGLSRTLTRQEREVFVQALCFSRYLTCSWACNGMSRFVTLISGSRQKCPQSRTSRYRSRVCTPSASVTTKPLQLGTKGPCSAETTSSSSGGPSAKVFCAYSNCIHSAGSPKSFSMLSCNGAQI